MRLVLATRNPGKLREVRQILAPTGIEVDEIGAFPELAGEDVEETGETFVENALIKARWAAERTGRPALADDSGLEVDALGGAPGVRSARYAGAQGDDAANNAKLVSELRRLERDGAVDRSARFRCVVALFVPDGVEAGRLAHWVAGARAQGGLESAGEGTLVRVEGGVAAYWAGAVEGSIVDDPRGLGGFGYDPHFVMAAGRTTAELSDAEKNAVSHRGEAFRKVAATLRRVVQG